MEPIKNRPSVAYGSNGGTCYDRAFYPHTPQGKRDAENHSKAVKKAGDGARGGMYDGMPLGNMSDYKTHYEVSFYGTSPAGGYDETLEEVA